MDETFALFLNEIPEDFREFVSALDKYLTSNGSKRTIKTAKSGYVTSYSHPKSGRALLNYVFRKSGVKMRIYAENIGSHYELLSDFPDEMKSDIIKAGDCKKLNGMNCTPTCTAGYSFVMDGTKYKKCKNAAFFHSLAPNNAEYIMRLIKAEIE